jgi:drug/metabolite transporter (DMT)-like permease
VNKQLHSKPQIQAILLVALSGILYGFMGFFGTKILKEHFSVENMLFWRFFIAGIWMFAYATFKHEKFLLGWSGSGTLTLPFIISAIFYAGSSGFYFLASKQTGTGLAMVIFFCYPVFVAIFAWIQKHWQLNKYSFVAFTAIIIGLFLLEDYRHTSISAAGIILAMTSALSYALYVYRSKRMIQNTHSSYFTIIICFNCAAVFFIITTATHTFTWPPSLHCWLYVIALGVIATAIPIQLLLEGLKIISSVKASILSVLEPVVTLIVGITLLSEPVTYLQMIGVLILLVGALVIQFARE